MLNNCNTHFYLTGGTAISRAYYNHRYSDDLDFFLSGEGDYVSQLNEVLLNLKQNNFLYSIENKDIGYISLSVKQEKNDAILKLEFVEDVSIHFGGFKKTEIFKKTDSIRNILSNKLTALFRYAGKDIVDIREIAIHEKFNWSDILSEAFQKEEGIDVITMVDIIKGIPKIEFEKIKWCKQINWKDFCEDLDIISFDLLNGKNNSLSNTQVR